MLSGGHFHKSIFIFFVFQILFQGQKSCHDASRPSATSNRATFGRRCGPRRQRRSWDHPEHYHCELMLTANVFVFSMQHSVWYELLQFYSFLWPFSLLSISQLYILVLLFCEDLCRAGALWCLGRLGHSWLPSVRSDLWPLQSAQCHCDCGRW